jgi:glycosyltransferase involved in cell wall biosynthesis
MRIAVVHSFYSSAQPSGENRVVVDQVAALRAAGHDVLLLGRYTDREQASPLYPLKAALTVATGWGADPTESLRAFDPDVVHIHNLFPNIGTAWLRRWKGPVVVSVHNYRSVCSNGLLFRDGKPCTECVTDGPMRAITHRCYRDSVVATIPVALSRSRDGRYLLERADAVVTTSQASDDVLKSVVSPDLRTVVIPNAGADEGRAPLPTLERSGWIALGRLSPEKGFAELVREWPAGRMLTLIGDGEEEAEIRSAIGTRSIDFRGSVPREELRELLPTFTGLVFPSRWPEAAPQVVVEAMRVGLPVVAHEGNGVAGLVADTGAGLAYRDAATLSAALGLVEADCDAFSDRARRTYAANWTPEVWLRSMTDVYARLMPSAASGRQ